MSIKPFRFETNIPPDQLLFNHELAIVLMWFEETPILHVAETHTGFWNASVLRSKRADDFRSSFVECWATLCTGYPNIMKFNEDAIFTAESFRDVAITHGIILQFSDSQSHNFIRAGEKYRESLRRVCRILLANHLTFEPEVVPRYAIKGLKDTMGLDWHVLSLLIFGTTPTFSIPIKDTPTYQYHIKTLRTAREGVASIRAE